MSDLTDKQMENISELMISTLQEARRRHIIDDLELNALEDFSISGMAAVAALEELQNHPTHMTLEVVN